MAESFGELALPTTAPGATESAGDPLLDVTVAWAKAVLNADLLTMYATRVTSGNPVRTTFTHDPEAMIFQESTLPALYVWRTGHDAAERIAQDILSQRSHVSALWVLPYQPHAEHERKRLPWANAITKIVGRALRMDRHPAWVASGDTDPQATDRGSVFARFAGWASMELMSAAMVPVTIQPGGDLLPRNYDAVLMKFDVTEWLDVDIEAAYDELEAVEQTITESDGTVTMGEAEYT